jgi:chromosome segregation ATPase
MKKRIAWVVAGIAVFSVALLAQSAPTDTLSALLLEVRQLRIAMERAATTTPQIQLLGARLGVQSERLAGAARDHDGARRELEEVSGALAQMAVRIPEVESSLAQEQDQNRQRAMAQELPALKEQMTELTAREQRLRLRESELATALSAEENQWADLNRRVDEVERSLTVRETR